MEACYNFNPCVPLFFSRREEQEVKPVKSYLTAWLTGFRIITTDENWGREA
jgi:hypothetical protein